MKFIWIFLYFSINCNFCFWISFFVIMKKFWKKKLKKKIDYQFIYLFINMIRAIEEYKLENKKIKVLQRINLSTLTRKSSLFEILQNTPNKSK